MLKLLVVGLLALSCAWAAPAPALTAEQVSDGGLWAHGREWGWRWQPLRRELRLLPTQRCALNPSAN